VGEKSPTNSDMDFSISITGEIPLSLSLSGQWEEEGNLGIIRTNFG